MRMGPRFFAVAVVAAAALLPKTGWVVRNEVDLLTGSWGQFGSGLGVPSFGLVPQWAFEPEAVGDPVAKAIAESTARGQSWSERWAWVRPLLRDPRVREVDRGAVLRRAFTSVLPARRGPAAVEKMRGIAKELLPLAKEGERADPFNAFYPVCRTVLEAVEGDTKARDAALRRASEGTYYDDDVWGETERFYGAFEREHGYRGSTLRLAKAASILLPQHAAFNHVVKDIVATAPLDDPRRREILAIGRTMVLTADTKIAVYFGRGLLMRAVSAKDLKEGVNVDAWFAPFEKANPGFATTEAKRLAKAAEAEESMDLSEFEMGLSSFATAVGAVLLLATLTALAVAWPARTADEALSARVRRANWAWLSLVPMVWLDGRTEAPGALGLLALGAAVVFGLSRFAWGWRPAISVAFLLALGGLAMAGAGAPMWGVPGLLWLAAVLPERGRAVGAGVVLTYVAGAAAWGVSTSHPFPPVYLWVATAFLAVAMRKSLPGRDGMAALPAAMAALWLVALGGELVADAQTGAAVDRLRHEASDFRRERAID